MIQALIALFKAIPALERLVNTFVSEWKRAQVAQAKQKIKEKQDKRDEAIEKIKVAKTDGDIWDNLSDL